jgi:hypothetical protein
MMFLLELEKKQGCLCIENEFSTHRSPRTHRMQVGRVLISLLSLAIATRRRPKVLFCRDRSDGGGCGEIMYDRLASRRTPTKCLCK